LFVSVLCTAAWLSSLVQDGCDFAQVKGPIVAELTTAGEIPPPWLEFGIGAYRSPIVSLDDADAWYSDSSQECQLLEETLMDTAWTTARTFAFLALVIGGGGTVFLWASTFFVFSRGTWRWTGYLLLIGSLCNAMTFLWFQSGICVWNTCTMFWGSQVDIVASVMWFLGGLLIVCKYPIPKHLQKRQADTTTIPTATVLATEEDVEETEERVTKAELV
jgi:hypothetical protein